MITHPPRALGSNLVAIGWVALATALFSFFMASGKFAGGALSTPQIMLLRYSGGFATVMAVLWAFPMRSGRRPSTRPLAHLLRAVFSVAGAFALIEASASMPIVDATAFSLLYVVFVVALGVLLLKERLRPRHGAGMALCCIGAAAIVLSRGAFSTFDAGYLGPALVAIAGAFFMALEGVLIKWLSSRDTPLVMIAYVNGFGCLLCLPFALLDWRVVDLFTLLPFLAFGPIGVLAQYCFVKGYSMADTAIVGPVDYTWLIYAAAIGAIFFGEVPSMGVIAGSALIILGGLVLATIRPHVEPVGELV